MVRVHPDPPTRRSPPGSIPGSRRISCRFVVSTAGRRCKRGAVAQLGEHLLCKQGVTGSIPVSSTNLRALRELRLGGPSRSGGCRAAARAKATSILLYCFRIAATDNVTATQKQVCSAGNG